VPAVWSGSGVTRALLSSRPAPGPRRRPPQNPLRSTTLDDYRPPEPEPEPKPPGLFAQIRSTRASAVRLATAHIDLAKAEASAIKGEIARVAAFVGIAVAVGLLALILLFVGSSLFLADWLLGSMGWGVLHGVLLLTAIAVACGLAAVGMSGARIGRAFLVGVLAAVAVGVLLTLALPNRLYTSIGDATLVGIEPGVRPLVVGAAIWAVIGLVGGLIAALRTSGGRARFGALLGGLVLGALVGAVTAVNTGPQVGIGIGITVGYITWIGLMALDISRTGVDMDDLKARFLPTQTIETSKETLAWLQSKMPPGTGS
jgi:hypothetical protein